LYSNFHTAAIMTGPKIYQSPFPSPNIPTNLSISQFLLQTNPDDVPDEKIVLADLDGPKYAISYRGIREAAASGAAGLRQLYGMSVGDIVCVYGRNSVNWAVLAHAVMWGGGCVRYVLTSRNVTNMLIVLIKAQ
jgi:4-coumarate--CoA ligase